jgi:hypothetical protein
MVTVRQRERRQRAAERLVRHAERSVEEQLELINERPGDSRKEVERITGGDFKSATDALTALREG